MTFSLSCMANQIASAIAAAESVTDRGLKIPILKTTRIEVSNGQAEFIATNTDQAIRTSIAASGSGIAHIDTDALSTKIKALRKDKPVDIEGDDKFVTVQQGRTKWKLPVLADTTGMDFRATADRIEGAEIDIAAPHLLAALRAVQPAFATDERHFISGPQVESDKGNLIVVATDGQLLHAVQVPGSWPEFAALLPPEAVNVILRIFDQEDGPLHVMTNGNSLTVEADGVFLRSKLIEGTFPAWRRVVPKTDGSAILDPASLTEAVERVAAIAQDTSKTVGRYVPVRLTVKESEIELSSKNRNGEEGSDYCSCERQSDAEFSCLLTADNLLTAIRSFGQIDTIEIGWAAPGKPIVLRRKASATEDFRVVMPMRG